MVLGFKEQFVDAIHRLQKKHTIRQDAGDRWKAGREIQFATGVRTKDYKQFAVGVCKGVQKIEFKWFHTHLGMVAEAWGVRVYIDGVDVTLSAVVDQLIKNDGFASREDFFKWEAWHRKDFTGKIIHWTDLRYLSQPNVACGSCGREMDTMEHNYGTLDIFTCLQCYHDTTPTSNKCEI